VLRIRRPQLGLPQPIVPVFWALVLIESTYGAYLGILPLWIEKLGAPIAIVGLLLGANGILRLFVIFPSTNIANRFGYRRTIMVARGAAFFGLMAAALATRWQQLILLVVGIAVGEIVFPLLQTLVATQAGDQRMRAFALVFTVGPSVALAIGPIVSGVLVALFGMRAAFLLAALLTALSFVMLRKIEEPAEHKERNLSQQAGYREALSDHRIRTITLLLIAVVFTCSLGVAFIPTFLEDVRGYQPATITTFSALGAVGSALFGLAVARTRRLQKEPFLGVAIAVGCIVLSLTLFHASGLLPVILVAYLLRGGFFSGWAMLNASLGVNAPARLRARGFAIVEMAGGLASSGGPIVGGFLYAKRDTLTFETAIVCGLVLIPVLLAENRRARQWPHETEPVPLEEEPVIGEIPEIAPELDLQPVIVAVPTAPDQAT
jgi:MFS family permease